METEYVRAVKKIVQQIIGWGIGSVFLFLTGALIVYGAYLVAFLWAIIPVLTIPLVYEIADTYFNLDFSLPLRGILVVMLILAGLSILN